MNRAYLSYCETWGIDTRRTSIYHPETNGKVERFITGAGVIKSYKQESAEKGDVTIQQTTPPRLTLNHQQSYVTPRNDNRTQETEMCCLQLVTITCCVAIGNGCAYTENSRHLSS